MFCLLFMCPSAASHSKSLLSGGMVWTVQECNGIVEHASGTDMWPVRPPTIDQLTHAPAIYPLETPAEIIDTFRTPSLRDEPPTQHRVQPM